jgi:plastocyanin
VNLDTSTHQIRNDIQGSLAQGALFSSDSLLKDARYSFKFDIPGTYPYYCTIHPSMKGTVIVT